MAKPTHLLQSAMLVVRQLVFSEGRAGQKKRQSLGGAPVDKAYTAFPLCGGL